ncbi:HEXXH motif domain-containing protein [Streptomyces sp. NPDC017890]|uniref:HEXXH motif domain-containing protein n=1 Tax=Streptomyces sp. NPDC017890 TaxID=3365015 RepID=UPI0037BDEC7B
MRPADSTPVDRSAFHSISEAGLRGLVQGGGHGAVIDELLSAERSRRLLLLKALVDRGAARSRGHERPPLSVRDAWELLERTQAKAPEAVDGVLMAPGTGTWVSSSLRQLRGAPRGEVPLWVTLGHLSSLAAAAAAAAGIAFTLWVPAREGAVSLPGLGCALLPTEQTWAAVRVTGDGSRLRITGAGGDVVVGPGWKRRTPDWWPTRRLLLGRGGTAGTLTLEEHDPFRSYSGSSAPSTLSEQEAEAWQRALGEAWKVLLRDEPAETDAMRHGLKSITPVPRGERFRPYSSSSAEAFGGINASLPDDGPELAATLVHEFQHVKLGALMHVEPLLRRADDADDGPELFHAPWRDDPRPLEGLLQGIYAFFGVTRFWRAHRGAADAAHASLAHFEFALWRDAVWSALDAVRGHPRLTPLGHRLLESLARTCAGWLAEPVPGEELRLAREAAASHRARWREHHLRPPSDTVDLAVRAWRRGQTCPLSVRVTPSSLRPDTDACFLDTAAILARHRLTDPVGPWRDPGAGAVRGAGPVDVLLTTGRRAAARRELTDRLLKADPSAGAWAALGRALADDPEQRLASRLLLRSPQWARAVRDTLVAEYGERPDPVDLAAWLGRTLEEPRPTG